MTEDLQPTNWLYGKRLFEIVIYCISEFIVVGARFGELVGFNQLTVENTINLSDGHDCHFYRYCCIYLCISFMTVGNSNVYWLSNCCCLLKPSLCWQIEERLYKLLFK